jgi:hypothetical protein
MQEKVARFTASAAFSLRHILKTGYRRTYW